MRAQRTTRVPTAAKLAVGVVVLAFPATAMAVTSTGRTDAHAVATLHAARPSAVRYGQTATVRGHAPIDAAGTAIELRYRAASAPAWHVVARGHVRGNGQFALTARLARSGGLQVVAAGNSVGASQVTAAEPASGSARVAPSSVQHLTVKPVLSLSGHQRGVMPLVGTATQIRGHLLPGVAGRRVFLEVQHGHAWRPAAVARTRSGGAFDLHYVTAATAGQRVEVAFAGDRLNSHADSASRAVTPMEYAEVSWYEDAGETACGFHATYGIASRTLPCGSKVTFSYGGRSVVATVDDRGPFVYSRLYDLDQTTAGALRMSGVATMLASV